MVLFTTGNKAVHPFSRISKVHIRNTREKLEINKSVHWAAQTESKILFPTIHSPSSSLVKSIFIFLLTKFRRIGNIIISNRWSCRLISSFKGQLSIGWWVVFHFYCNGLYWIVLNYIVLYCIVLYWTNFICISFVLDGVSFERYLLKGATMTKLSFNRLNFEFFCVFSCWK